MLYPLQVWAAGGCCDRGKWARCKLWGRHELGSIQGMPGSKPCFFDLERWCLHCFLSFALVHSFLALQLPFASTFASSNRLLLIGSVMRRRAWFRISVTCSSAGRAPCSTLPRSILPVFPLSLLPVVRFWLRSVTHTSRPRPIADCTLRSPFLV